MYNTCNPVEHDEKTGYWYFWDETWSDKHGPYDSEKECLEKLDEYIKEFMEGK